MMRLRLGACERTPTQRAAWEALRRPRTEPADQSNESDAPAIIDEGSSG
jgi:hypothetical protein